MLQGFCVLQVANGWIFMNCRLQYSFLSYGSNMFKLFLKQVDFFIKKVDSYLPLFVFQFFRLWNL